MDIGTNLRIPIITAMKSLRDLVLPPSCLLCAARVGSHFCLCPRCWRAADFITKPRCEITGVPFAHEWPEGTQSRLSQMFPPLYDHARAALRYEAQTGRPLVLRMKYADRPEMALRMAAWMARAAADLLPQTDMIAPVPLHWQRLLSRRFNQAAELARALARDSSIDFYPDLLLRVRPTRSQIGLTRAARRRNVRGAFQINPTWRKKLQGKSVLLVDDVMTSGATLASCAKTLRRAGAGQINVATLARVIHAEETIV